MPLRATGICFQFGDLQVCEAAPEDARFSFVKHAIEGNIFSNASSACLPDWPLHQPIPTEHFIKFGNEILTASCEQAEQ